MRRRIAIRGLVKSKRLVEQRLKAGVLPAQQTTLICWIEQLVGEVEAICARYHLSPDDLPTPSQRAYTYLKSLAEHGLPEDAQRSLPPPDPALVTSFRRVNRKYFDGRLAQPILAWSQRRTRREFGRYIPETDQLIISRTLAAPQIPDWVLDFVMYHELLHKHLGIRRCNGRSYSHTPEFRRAEQRYARYEPANRFLQELSARKSLRRK